MISAVIIDDEKLCRNALIALLKPVEDITVIGQASNVKEGESLIKTLNPQLVFLDIEMPDGTGFDLLNKFSNPNFQVVFTTGHNAYAIKAFKHSAIDYLLKPVQKNEFLDAVEKVKKLSSFSNKQDQLTLMLKALKDQEYSKIAIPSVEGYEFVEKNDIVCCEADGSYTTIHLNANKKVISSYNLKRLNDLLQENGFFRIHKSYIINTKFIKKILNSDGGSVLLENEMLIPIARRRKDEFLQNLGL